MNVANDTAVAVHLTPIMDEFGNQISSEEGLLFQVVENGDVSFRYIRKNIKNSLQVTDTPESETQHKFEWGDDDTRLLLDLYASGLAQVGPLKRFRKKKDLWEYISQQINIKLGLDRTAAQCQSRYKTILKRKGEQDKQNKTSGQIRCPVNFENEIGKIKAIDDSLEPEVMMSSNRLAITKKNRIEEDPSTSQAPKPPAEKKKRMEKQDLLTLFEKMHKEKEQNRERRHQEKIKVRKEIIGNIKKDD